MPLFDYHATINDALNKLMSPPSLDTPMANLPYCPKCQRPQVRDTGPQDACPHCGIIYTKYHAKQLINEITDITAKNMVINTEDGLLQKILAPWVYIPERVSIETLLGRAFMWMVFVIWSLYFFRAGIEWEKLGSSFLHNVNLPFHEFGHVLFRPFGETLTILGGSLFQVLMPFCIMILFVFQQKEIFGASISLWWCGQNFIDLAPYIDDAPYRSLPLTTGNESGHDWGNLLTQWNALNQANHLAQISRRIGLLIMAIALAWGLWILWQQKNNRTNEFVPNP